MDETTKRARAVDLSLRAECERAIRSCWKTGRRLPYRELQAMEEPHWQRLESGMSPHMTAVMQEWIRGYTSLMADGGHAWRIDVVLSQDEFCRLRNRGICPDSNGTSNAYNSGRAEARRQMVRDRQQAFADALSWPE